MNMCNTCAFTGEREWHGVAERDRGIGEDARVLEWNAGIAIGSQ